MTSLPLSHDYATSKFDLLVEIELSLSHTHKEKRRSEHISTCILCIFYTYARCPIDTEAQHPALRRPRELARSTGYRTPNELEHETLAWPGRPETQNKQRWSNTRTPHVFVFSTWPNIEPGSHRGPNRISAGIHDVGARLGV